MGLFGKSDPDPFEGLAADCLDEFAQQHLDAAQVAGEGAEDAHRLAEEIRNGGGSRG